MLCRRSIFLFFQPQPIVESVSQSRSDSDNGSGVYDIADEGTGDSFANSEAEANMPTNDPSVTESRVRSPIVRRSAILPPQESTVLTTVSRTEAVAVPSAPTQSLSSSPTAPPVLPRRNKGGAPLAPPALPPKPEQLVTARPVSCNAEGDSSNARKSVADMARLFSSTDAPFARH